MPPCIVSSRCCSVQALPAYLTLLIRFREILLCCFAQKFIAFLWRLKVPFLPFIHNGQPIFPYPRLKCCRIYALRKCIFKLASMCVHLRMCCYLQTYLMTTRWLRRQQDLRHLIREQLWVAIIPFNIYLILISKWDNWLLYVATNSIGDRALNTKWTLTLKLLKSEYILLSTLRMGQFIWSFAEIRYH